jgi:DNA-directed RNA polymerase subunit H (RpoH/RPB5)
MGYRSSSGKEIQMLDPAQLLLDPEGTHLFQELELERRQLPRYTKTSGIFAINSYVLGPVIDINEVGMAFDFYANDLPDSTDGKYRLGIFSSHHDFLLTGIRCLTIKDFIVSTTSSALPLIRKRRCVQFQDLTLQQEQSVRELVQNL